MEEMIGSPVERREDSGLITGSAKFLDDISGPDLLHMAVLRSQYSHARIHGLETSEAKSLDEVVAVFTAEDLREAGMSPTHTTGGPLPGQEPVEVSILAEDVVRHSGEALAVVLAEERYTAYEALDLINVDYERLDSVVDPEAALEPESPLVHDEMADNRAFEFEVGDESAIDETFNEAAHTIKLEVENQRLLPNPMETRGAYAVYDSSKNDLSIQISTQAPHRDRGELARLLSIPEDNIHVEAPSVGGAFGTKVNLYEDEALTAWCAIQLEQPVKWSSTRSEGHKSDHHGRGIKTTGELAVSEAGHFLGFRVNAIIGAGAYHHRAFIPIFNYATLLSGQYDIPSIHAKFVGAFTNTSPVGPYRGAGRPEAVFTLERLVDEAASELGLDPVEVRRLNQIPSDKFPYETAIGEVYDSGDYSSALDLALEEAKYEHWREEQSRLREDGRFLGVGLACFVENTGSDSRSPEWGRVKIDVSGQVMAYTGTADGGQGHETTFCQILSQILGIPMGDINFQDGNSDVTPDGVGTYSSRSVAVGGSALAESAEKIVEKARELAANHFEAPSGDITFKEGEFSVSGTDRSIGIQELIASSMNGTDSNDSNSLEALTRYEPTNNAFSFGTHLAVVEVDPELGDVEIKRYVAVDDCGVQINPMIVEGQVHGGVAQGIGQALLEKAIYDESGNLATGSLQDYPMPRAHNTPDMLVTETVTPCPHNPLGAKGAGESGTLAAPPAVVNAVIDALRPFGVTHIDMPLTSENVWQSVKNR